jgi:hypothetical protein
MTVKFTFLTGDVDWTKSGAAWISQKFNDGTDYWLIREITNWKENGQSQEAKESGFLCDKYTLTLSRVRPSSYTQDNCDSAIKDSFGDSAKWDEHSEKERVEALYTIGHYIQEKFWDGNNYSDLFKECQAYANAFVQGDEVSPSVDFSKLPETFLVAFRKNSSGDLQGEPITDRYDQIILAATQKNDRAIYIVYRNIEKFVQEFIPPHKRKHLEKGSQVTVRFSTYRYLVYLGNYSEAFLQYHSEQMKKEATELKGELLPNLFAEIEGVPIYHVHKDGYGLGPENDFWYSTAQSPEDLHEEYSFRVDKFDPDCRVKSIGDEPASVSWERFIDHCKQVIAQALRDKKLKLAPAPDAAVLGGQPSIPKNNMANATSVVLGTASQCQHPDHTQFCRDMAAAGIPTQMSGKRFLWQGPVAKCDDISDIMSRTRIPCLWDESGKSFLVYPKAYAAIDLINLVERFEDENFKKALKQHLMLNHPLKAMAQNVIDHVAPYFPEEIPQR